MAIVRIGTDEFMALARQHAVLDVRSPGEYGHAHIPGAYNLPLFSDEERKVVGTAYKQERREQAIKIGLDYFGVKMRAMVEQAVKFPSSAEAMAGEAKHLTNDFKTGSKLPCVLVHCWRGGMRSAGVAWLLDLYGFKVYTLDGGYKAFRNWVLLQFEKEYSFKILGGYTGAGKTEVLKQLEKDKHLVIDLEGIAHHKGSAFGALGQAPQPTQEMFENVLGLALHNISREDEHKPIWLEDESQRIGSVNLPNALWHTMRLSQVYFLDIPFEERLNYIAQEYGEFERKELVESIMRIQKRLGGQNTKDAINYLLEGNIKESFRILLHYYDKYYSKGLEERKDHISVIASAEVDAERNARLVREKIIV